MLYGGAMPTLIDPFTSTKIQWLPGKCGRVTITGTLVPDPESPVPFPCTLPLRVTFQRQDLTEALSSPLWRDPSGRPSDPVRPLGQDYFFHTVAGGIVTALANLASLYSMDARDFSTFRKQKFSLSLSALISEDRTFRYRVTVPQWLFAGYGSQVKKFFRQDGSFTGLRIELSFLLFPPHLRGYLIRPPRGRKARGWPLRDCLPAALFFARHLVVDKAAGDPSLMKRFIEVLEGDQACLDYIGPGADSLQALSQKRTVLALVDRAFRGAWGRYDVKALMKYALPKEVFDQYFYGQRRAHVMQAWKKFNKHGQEQVTIFWFGLLLGPPGQAARDFCLLT